MPIVQPYQNNKSKMKTPSNKNISSGNLSHNTQCGNNKIFLNNNSNSNNSKVSSTKDLGRNNYSKQIIKK